LSATPLSSPTQTLTLKDLLINSGLTTYTNVTFDDAAGISIVDATNPITGSFQPEGFVPVPGTPPSSGTSLASTIPAFSGFNGSTLSSGTNTWTLSVFNSDEAGTAELGGVTLNVSASSSATPVPFETNASLGLLVLGGLYGGHRWLKSRSNSPLS